MGATRFDEAFARVETLMGEWRLEEATRVLEGLKADGSYPNRLRHDLSVLHAQQGFFDEALAEIEAALEAEPGNRALWHHFLAIQKNNPMQPTPREWRAMHLAFGDTLRDFHDERHLAMPRSEGRRLRVGLLCPDTHLATERFVWPLLEHLDPGAYEVFSYWTHAVDLAPMQRDYPSAVHRSIKGLDDPGVVAQLVGDAIDIAIDIAGHGAGNVLPALARRPAPVAITWLDYLATTGMPEIDYRLTDGVADPAGAEAAHVERLLRLGRAQWCYRPPAAARDAPVATRVQRSAPVLGSASVPLKLSDPLLDTWARLLLRVPGSRLRFLGIPEGRARARILQRLAGGGIDSTRIEIRPRLSQAAFLAELGEIDVVLDSYPFSGATSTLDALWQGVPVVSLAGPLSHGRSTASILATLGKEEWIASTPDELVDIAASLALDPARLEHERTTLRARLAGSPLCDGPAFAGEVGRALRAAWDARPTGRANPTQESTRFWHGVKALAAPGGERVALAGIAEVIDVAAGHAVSADGSDWLLFTHSGFFDPSTIAASIPEDLLEHFDVLAALGADALSHGDIAGAGDGRVAGVRLIAEAGRLYASAWAPERPGRSVVQAGGALLVRRSLVTGMTPIGPAVDAADFSRHVARLSHQLFLLGARLGVAAGLAAAERAWPTARGEWAAHRALERDLGLPRWGQQEPGARAMKVVLTPSGWEAIRTGLEARISLSNG